QNNIEQINIEQNDISDNIREGSYRSLLNMARTITSSLNDEKILHIILQETISVLPGADTGFLYLYDEEKNRLFLKARIGFRHEYHEYDNVNLKVGEAISGKTFQYGQSLILNGVEKVINYSSDMTDENMNNYLQLTSQQDFPRAVISTVLKAQSKILGVLTIDNFSSPIDFTEEDLQLLQAAADHAAVVISQAQLLRREKQYLKKMELMNQKLYKEHSLLEKTLNIHNQLISIALEGKGFGRIVGFLAKMIACPVTVFDLYLKPMAVSDNAQDKALPDNLLSCEEMKKLLYTQEKQRIFLEDPLESIHLLPVIGANKILGILGVWVAEDQQLSDLDNVVLNYTTMIIAMEWIKQDAILETSQKLKGEFMQGVLWGNLDRGLLEHSKQLGLDMEDFFAVILFSIVEDQAEQNLSIGNYQNKQILHSIINLLEKQHLKGIVNAEKDYLCLLLSTKDNKQNNANKDIDLLCQKLRQIYPLMRIGIG
ncbi:MAG: GAF domain-containing protein, partial [Clostridiales bacterium]